METLTLKEKFQTVLITAGLMATIVAVMFVFAAIIIHA